jgi:Tol biopolymer transport system component
MRRFVGVLLACLLLAGCGGGSSGDRIAFMSDRDGDDEIFVMNTDGTEVRQLTDNDDSDWDPSWSPNGKRIAFKSARDGDWEIFVMNADGTDTYSTGQEGTHPDFGG